MRGDTSVRVKLEACDESEDSGGGRKQAKEEFDNRTGERLGNEAGILGENVYGVRIQKNLMGGWSCK